MATGHYSRGVMIDNGIRLSEYTGLILAVVIGLSVKNVLLTGLIIKTILFVFKCYDSNRFFNININLKFLRIKELKKIFLPALSFFSFPISNSLTFQGFTLIINFFMGSSAVVLFNTTRTLVNFSRSAIDILHKSLWPEVTLSFGKQNLSLLRKIHYKTLIFSFLLSVLTSLMLFFIGEYLYTAWTKSAIHFDPILFNLLLVALITNAIWSSSNVLLQATNNHKIFSLLYFSLAVIGFFITFFIVSYFKSVSFIPISMLIVDVLLIGYALKKALSISGDSFTGLKSGLYYEIINLPKSISIMIKKERNEDSSIY